jgi:predicted Zn-dependent protease
VLAAVRSLRPLSDPRRASVQPVKLRLQSAPSAGEFRSVWGTLGTGLVAVEEGALINGLEPDEAVLKGQALKLADAPTKW